MCPAPRRSIYRVWIEDGSQVTTGTAFAVKLPNFVVTASHVVRGKDLKSGRLMSSLFQRRSFRFDKLAQDNDSDLALLRLVDPDPDFTPLAVSSTPPVNGQLVWASGYPTTHYGSQQIQMERDERHLAVCPCTVVPGPLPDTVKSDLVFFTEPKLSFGMSGSPIVGPGNKVVGVLVSILRAEKWSQWRNANLSMCVCSFRLAQLLGRLEAETEPAAAPALPSPSDKAAGARHRRRWWTLFRWG